MSQWTQRIGTKPALAGLIAIISILLIEALLSWLYASKTLNADFKAEVNSHLSSSAEAMIMPIWDLDIESLDGMAKSISLTPNVISVKVTDPADIILTHHVNHDVAGGNPLEISRNIEAAYNRNIDKTGTLTIVYSRTQIGKKLMHIAWKSTARMIVFCVLFFGVLLITISTVVLPIRSLEQTVRKYNERQNLSFVPGEDRDDEMGSLARGFKYMAKQIHQNVATLEARVIQRTRELNSAVQDVVAANKKLENAALHDPLTGLPNRLFISKYLEEEIQKADATNNTIAVAHIDLDNFKKINDTYGHSAGDFMLVQMSLRMKEWINGDKMIARVGGDEFLLISTDCRSPKDIESEITGLLSALMQPLNFEGITLQTSASIGVSHYPNSGCDSNELIVNADLALYKAKADGRGCIQFFKKPMRQALNWQKTLEAEMVIALEKQQFVPFFQPQVDIATGNISGVEVLARWKHEDRGLIPPDVFLPVAERAGLMVSLGKQIIEKAIISAADWQANKIEFGRLALNLSAVELAEEGLVDWLLSTAEKHNLSAEKLSVEILETVIIDDERFDLVKRLRHLRQAGVYVELDDFGTGYASLQQLNAEEIDRIKIDRSFIKGINLDQNKAAIVKAIVDMTLTMGVEVIAEGAETKNELDTLFEFGCHVVQGYGIAKPMPVNVMDEWLNLFCGHSHQINAAVHIQKKIERTKYKLTG